MAFLCPDACDVLVCLGSVTGAGLYVFTRLIVFTLASWREPLREIALPPCAFCAAKFSCRLLRPLSRSFGIKVLLCLNE